MHSLLESYLSEVAAKLGPMPVEQRSEELREMRQHLLNAVTVNQEIGQREDEAVQNAVTQFGTPADLGGNLVWAWRREQTRNKKSLLGAAVTVPLALCLICFLMNQRWFDLFLDHALNTILPRAFLMYLGEHPGYGMDFTQAMFMLMFGLAGLAAGGLFPRQAVRGACLGLGLFWLGFAAVDGIKQLTALVSLDGLIHQGRGGWILSVLAFAWLGSRWRNKGRSRQAVRL